MTFRDKQEAICRDRCGLFPIAGSNCELRPVPKTPAKRHRRDGTDGAARDAFLGLMKTCDKLGVSFRDYLGSRLMVADAPAIMALPELVRQNAHLA